jgi:outer membrane lipoprotein-sorting protein
VAATLLLNCTVVFSADTNVVINRWLAAQTNVQTYNADFVQTRRLKTLTQPLTATGHLWFAQPNHFRWELRSPSQTIALRQAEEMWVIYPLLKRAERYPLDAKAPGEWRDALALLEAGFPRDRREFDSRFRVLSLTETNGNWLFDLQPASAFARKMMKRISIGLKTNDFALVSTELEFVDGSVMRNDFTNGVLNAGFGKEVFDWKPPADFKVTQPLGK